MMSERRSTYRTAPEGQPIPRVQITDTLRARIEVLEAELRAARAEERRRCRALLCKECAGGHTPERVSREHWRHYWADRTGPRGTSTSCSAWELWEAPIAEDAPRTQQDGQEGGSGGEGVL